MKKILVIYHKDCSDGFGAAWTAWKKFGARAEYVPVEPERLPKKFPKGREIYAIDVSFPLAVQKELRAKNEKVVVIDHHASRKADTQAFPENVFDNDHSGSVLAWRYFYPKKKIPLFLRYIEEFDLWKFKMPHTMEIFACLDLIEHDFRAWSDFARRVENPKTRRKIVREGTVIKAYERRLIGQIVKTAFPAVFAGHKTLVAYSPVLHSLVAHELLRKMSPIAVTWKERKGGTSISLRSNGTVDVSKIAARYGGGGHKRAASFRLKSGKKFPWKRIK